MQNKIACALPTIGVFNYMFYIVKSKFISINNYFFINISTLLLLTNNHIIFYLVYLKY